MIQQNELSEKNLLLLEQKKTREDTWPKQCQSDNIKYEYNSKFHTAIMNILKFQLTRVVKRKFNKLGLKPCPRHI